MIYLSQEKEFVFGDGIYNNLAKGNEYSAFQARILAPITPHIAVLYWQPTNCARESRIATCVANDETIDAINETVQVFSKDVLFYQRLRPNLLSPFKDKEHLSYEQGDPVDILIEWSTSFFREIPNS